MAVVNYDLRHGSDLLVFSPNRQKLFANTCPNILCGDLLFHLLGSLYNKHCISKPNHHGFLYSTHLFQVSGKKLLVEFQMRQDDKIQAKSLTPNNNRSECGGYQVYTLWKFSRMQ